MMNSVGVDDSAGSCPYSLILSLNEMTVQTVFLSNKVVTSSLLYCDVVHQPRLFQEQLQRRI